MGWCSATEIMDTALKAALTAVDRTVTAVLDAQGEPPSAGRADAVAEILNSEELDGVLSPFVATLARKLRDSDWDCIEESDYFDRFPQEMLGMDDREYAAHLHDQLRDTGPEEYNFAALVRKLAEVTERMENAD